MTKSEGISRYLSLKQYGLNRLSVANVEEATFSVTVKKHGGNLDSEFAAKLDVWNEDELNAYNEKAVYYYQNIDLGAIYISDKKILYENLKVILSKIKRLNELSRVCNFKRTAGMII